MNNFAFRIRPLVRASGLALVATASVGATIALASGTHAGGHGDEFTFGKPGDPSQVSRTVEVIATDMAFEPSRIEVKDGENVRFVVHNRGGVLHEFNIGTPAMHREHQEEMQEMMEHGLLTSTDMPHQAAEMHQQTHGHGGHGHHDEAPMVHDDPNSILLQPGETKELIWIFDEARSLQFACNVPGHYQAGMHGRLEIE